MINLTDTEIDDICSGYKQGEAKVRYLQSFGLTVRRKPNGRPLVVRQHYCQVMGMNNKNQFKNDQEPIWGVH